MHAHPQSSPKGKKAFTQTFTIHPLLQFHVKSAVFTMIAIATYMKKQYAALLVMYYRKSPVTLIDPREVK